MSVTHRFYRGLAASLMLGFGLLQVWDSGALSSPLHVLVQIVPAVLLPPGAVLLSKRGGVWAVVVSVSAVLYWLARWASPRPLPALTLVIGFQVAVLYLLYRALRKHRGGISLPVSSAEEVRA